MSSKYTNNRAENFTYRCVYTLSANGVKLICIANIRTRAPSFGAHFRRCVVLTEPNEQRASTCSLWALYRPVGVFWETMPSSGECQAIMKEFPTLKEDINSGILAKAGYPATFGIGFLKWLLGHAKTFSASLASVCWRGSPHDQLFESISLVVSSFDVRIHYKPCTESTA